jgi:hypothetical protein
MRSNIIIAAGLLLFAAIVLTTRKPAEVHAQSNFNTDRGIVMEVYETSFKDFVVKLKGQAKSYYIDSGPENNITLQDLKEKLLYKPVTIHYPDRWSPIKRTDSKHYISRLEYEGEVVFNDGD